MATSPVFDAVCEQLEKQTSLDRLAMRGTVRISLKEAGLDAKSVSWDQMLVVLARVLPGELGSRGVDNAASLCEDVTQSLASTTFDAVSDRIGMAASTLDRFGL